MGVALLATTGSQAFNGGLPTAVKTQGMVAFDRAEPRFHTLSVGQPVEVTIPAAQPGDPPDPPACMSVPTDTPLPVTCLSDAWLSRIGEHFGVEWKRLYDANFIADPNNVPPGQSIRIPAADEQIPPRDLPSHQSGWVGGASVSAPTADAPATASTDPPASGGQSIVSTGYSWGCGASGSTASGENPHYGGVASHTLPMGTSWQVLDGPLAGQTFTVNDTGPGATFDIFMDSCGAANNYGRRTIQIQEV